MVDLTDSHLDAARRLLEQESGSVDSADWGAAAGAVYRVLSQHLSPVIGNAGVRALFKRCAKLNKKSFPFLAAIKPPVDTDDELVGAIVTALAATERARGHEAAVVLYATFFALLATFIGERLAWQIVQRAFEDDGTASEETE